MKKEDYTPRLLGEKLLTAFTDGIYKEIIEIVKEDEDLDLQIRANYVNIYYKGGNIAKILNPNGNVFFDIYYFLKKSETPKNAQTGQSKINVYGDPNRNIPKRQDIIDELKSRCEELKKLFKNKDYKSYFKSAKKQMDMWFKDWGVREEKETQQKIIKYYNTKYNPDYTILDTEYQVSILAPFKFQNEPKCKYQHKAPRFDLIAVDKEGKLCVIELKKGCGACTGKAGLYSHLESFTHTIKREYQPFIGEFKTILEQKQKLGLIDKKLHIIDKEPEFVLVYVENQQDDFNSFIEKCKKEKIQNVKTIKLELNSTINKKE